jgi:N,N'-diacetyllegionaminate synthase
MTVKTRFSNRIKIANKVIDANSPCFIIAEAGVNHNGDLDLARKLIDVAVEAGADAVKFQTFKTEELILDNVSKAKYQQGTTDASESQFAMLKKLEVQVSKLKELHDYASSNGIILLTTPFDEKSLDELDLLDLPAYKVASTDTTNLPFLLKMAAKKKPLLLSTGMTYQAELDVVLTALSEVNSDIILLQCTANYPIADDEANLLVVKTFQERYEILVGYSDHSTGIGAAPYALPLGAKVLEKHFTIDKSLPGPDQQASLDPEELKEFVQTVRRVESYLGSTIKSPTRSELANRNSLQKCLVYVNNFKQGHLLRSEDIIARRTGGSGLSPLKYQEFIGQKLKVAVNSNQILSGEDFE